MVRKQAGLWERSGLLSAEAAAGRLARVGLAPDRPETRPDTRTWLAGVLAQVSSLPESAAQAAALIAEALRGGPALRPSFRGQAPPTPAEMGVEELVRLFEEAEPLTLTAEGRWAHLVVRGGEVLLRVGTSPAQRFETFVVEFRRGEETLLAVPADSGIARIDLSGLREALRQGTTSLRVLR